MQYSTVSETETENKIETDTVPLIFEKEHWNKLTHAFLSKLIVKSCLCFLNI